MDYDRNIAEQLAGLQRDLGRMEGKLDSVLITVATNENEVSDVEKRMRSVETKQAVHTSVAGILGGFAGIAANWLIYHFR